MNAKATISFPPLDRTASTETQIGLLDGWVRNVLATLYGHVETLELADAQLKSDLEAAAEAQRASLDEVNEDFTQLATGTLRLRSWSVYLIILGTIALTIGGALVA